MRIILSIIALFSAGGLLAQEYVPTCGRELPRSRVTVYPTAQEAAAAAGGKNRYVAPLDGWTRQGNTLSAPFTVPFAWINRQVILRIDWVSGPYTVRINGREAACDADGNAPAEYNVTRLAREGRNELEIVVAEPSPTAVLESWKESPVPAAGPALVMSQPTLRVRDVETRTRIGEDGDATAEVGVVLKTHSLNPRTSRLRYTLLSPSGRTVTTGSKELTLDMRREDTVRFLARIPYDSLWCDTLPTQYRLQLATQHDGRYEEYLELPLGFRTAEVRDGRMTINGREVALRCREVPARSPPRRSRRCAPKGTTRCACCPARFRRRCSTVATPGGSTSSYRLRWTPGGAAIRAAWAATRPTTPLGVRPTPNAPRTVTTRPSCTRRSSPSRWRRTRPTASTSTKATSR